MDSDGPCDECSDDKSDSGELVEVCMFHTSCTRSTHLPVVIN